MPKSIHFICDKLPVGQPMNVSHIEGTKTFISGYWDINDAQAEALVGGWLYLHETKARPSYFGGKIIDFRHELRPDVVRTDRIGLIFYPRAEAKKSVSWRGQQHGRAWTGGLVEADLLHETTEQL